MHGIRTPAEQSAVEFRSTEKLEQAPGEGQMNSTQKKDSAVFCNFNRIFKQAKENTKHKNLRRSLCLYVSCL